MSRPLPSKERYNQIILERRQRLAALGYVKPTKRPKKVYDSVKEHLLFRICVDPNTGCWLWTMALNNAGYPFVSIGGKMKLCHRVSFEEYKGEIPEGLDIAHKCDCTYCINPAHLWPATAAENTADMIAKGRDRFQDGSSKRGFHGGMPKGGRFYTNGTDNKYILPGEQPPADWILLVDFRRANKTSQRYKFSDQARANISRGIREWWRQRKAA